MMKRQYRLNLVHGVVDVDEDSPFQGLNVTDKLFNFEGVRST